MVTIDRERLISEKQNNKASPTGAGLPKEAMLFYSIITKVVMILLNCTKNVIASELHLLIIIQ